MALDLITKYFPGLTEDQISKFQKLEELYKDWNLKINVVSRKDIDELYLRHVLHSLGIAKIQKFKPGSKILDVGTGGGFPGIPLAILYPESTFHLVDSIGKKITVVEEVAQMLDLENVVAEQARAEKLRHKYHFVVSRAVTQMPKFVAWVRQKIHKQPLKNQKLANGILYLKGGDLTEELIDYPQAIEHKISKFFDEDFFETKKVIYLPL